MSRATICCLHSRFIRAFNLSKSHLINLEKLYRCLVVLPHDISEGCLSVLGLEEDIKLGSLVSDGLKLALYIVWGN